MICGHKYTDTHTHEYTCPLSAVACFQGRRTQPTGNDGPEKMPRIEREAFMSQ